MVKASVADPTVIIAGVNDTGEGTGPKIRLIPCIIGAGERLIPGVIDTVDETAATATACLQWQEIGSLTNFCSGLTWDINVYQY
jgi:hypothetical protein